MNFHQAILYRSNVVVIFTNWFAGWTYVPIVLYSSIMLSKDVDFKTLSDRYTNSRMLPFLTHIYIVRANLFSINPLQKMTPTMVNQQLFFTVKLDATNSFLSNRQRYDLFIWNGTYHEKTYFCHMWPTKAQINLHIHAVWSAPLLFAAWIVTRLYSSKLYSSIGTYTVSATYQLAEGVLSLHVWCQTIDVLNCNLGLLDVWYTHFRLIHLSNLLHNYGKDVASEFCDKL